MATVAVYEPAPSSAIRARQVLQTLGYNVTAESEPKAIVERMASTRIPDVVLLALPEGDAIADAARASEGERPILIASLAGPPATATRRFADVDADLFAVRPHSIESLGPVLHAATVLHRREEMLRVVRGTEERLREQLAETGHSELLGVQHFDYFQRLLVTEIKRAKRYGYSLAVCLIGPDPWPGAPPSPSAQLELRRRAAAAVTAVIRDVDMPVDYADDRLLLFLPYTDLEGARRVGQRAANAVTESAQVLDGGETVRLSVSIGIAALKPGQPISFARLMRDASAALKAAQLKGGGRVVVRR